MKQHTLNGLYKKQSKNSLTKSWIYNDKLHTDLQNDSQSKAQLILFFFSFSLLIFLLSLENGGYL